MKDVDLERLLKSAAHTSGDQFIEMPFGFDTRVVALWRSNGNGGIGNLAALLRRVALLASAVIVVASAGVYQQINRNRDLSDSSANDFAIADSVIQDEFVQ